MLDHNTPTTRKRWYAVFRRDGRPIVWPRQTHNKEGTDGLKKWVGIHTVLDFLDFGRSIFGRKKPLADNTMKRIARGLGKFVFENPEPFIVQVDHGMTSPYIIQYHSETGGEVRGQTVKDPVRTIDTSNRYANVMAFLTKFYKSGTGQELSMPIHTITTSPGHFGQVSVFAVKLEELLKAGVPDETARKCTWVSEFIIEYYGCGTGQAADSPIHTVVTKDRFALVTVMGDEYVILDIFLRMLTPEELKLGQGFPKDYIIDRDYRWRPYPKSEQVKRIGNSVVPVMAKALVEANCPYLKIGERVPCMGVDYAGEQLSMIV